MSAGSRLWSYGDTIRWGLLSLVFAIDALWLLGSGRSLGAQGVRSQLLFVGVLGVSGGLLALVAQRQARRSVPQRLRVRELAVTAHCLCWLLLFMSGMWVLSYLLVTLAAPLVDRKLAALDAALGFHWPAVHAWVRARPWLSELLDWCYNYGRLQILLLPLLIGLYGPVARLREFLSGMLVSLTLVLLIAAPFPAGGAYYHFDGASAAELAQVSHFIGLRDGSLRVFDLEAAQGLVSMPSFHTVLALLFIQAMWWSRPALLLVVPFNLVMILSTPSQGGHYLVDMLAGGAVWAFTLLAVRSWRRGADGADPRAWLARMPRLPASRFGRLR